MNVKLASRSGCAIESVSDTFDYNGSPPERIVRDMSGRSPERPEHPELILETAAESAEDLADRILQFLRQRGPLA